MLFSKDGINGTMKGLFCFSYRAFKVPMVDNIICAHAGTELH